MTCPRTQRRDSREMLYLLPLSPSSGSHCHYCTTSLLPMAQQVSENRGTNNCSHQGYLWGVRIFFLALKPNLVTKTVEKLLKFLRSSFASHFIWGHSVLLALVFRKKMAVTAMMLTLLYFCTSSPRGSFYATPPSGTSTLLTMDAMSWFLCAVPPPLFHTVTASTRTC